MSAPEISTSTREERLAFIREEFRCLHNCEICGKCSFLKSREAEDIYKDYIEGIRSFMEITKATIRKGAAAFRLQRPEAF